MNLAFTDLPQRTPAWLKWKLWMKNSPTIHSGWIHLPSYPQETRRYDTIFPAPGIRNSE